MRYLGVDFGLRHVGLAIGEKIPHEYGTLEAKNSQELILEISKICQKEKIETIIIGMPPKRTSQADSPALIATQNFVSALGTSLEIPIKTVDESFSSVEAEMILSDAGIDWRKAKTRVHQLSAVLILNQYLASLERK